MMMTKNLIAGNSSAQGVDFLQSVNPANQEALPGQFNIATEEEINQAAEAAQQAFLIFRKSSGILKAKLLRTIADEIEALGDSLIQRAMLESGLPHGRLLGERGRTCGQLRTFADYVKEGSWVDAIIDEAMPDRKPFPRVDIRKYAIALGPVAVFTASNFPLAFSTAGGDTAAALAAGCPVIVKAHPAHLGTNAMVANAISTAVEKCGLPAGLFSSINGEQTVGQNLVRHPFIKAVGFTGSLRGGRAIFNIANSRPQPIPVYAEMGSNNPVFILPEKLKKEFKTLASSIAASVNLGAGQFCTNPGLLVVQNGESLESFITELKKEFEVLQAQIMLHAGIHQAYNNAVSSCLQSHGVRIEIASDAPVENGKGRPTLASISAGEFLANEKLHEEVFGPFTLLIICNSAEEVHSVAQNLSGQLTATVMATANELTINQPLCEILTEKAGRVLFNGVPTGVEICAAMHHGGPYPATTNSQYTSVGVDAIKRFTRPICYQNAPAAILPPELQADNPLNIWRTVNGQKTKA